MPLLRTCRCVFARHRQGIEARPASTRKAVFLRRCLTTTTADDAPKNDYQNVNNQKAQRMDQNAEDNVQIFDNLQQLLGLDSMKARSAEEERQRREHFALRPYNSRINPEAYGYDPIDGTPTLGVKMRSRYANNWRDEPSNLTLTSEKVRKVRGIHDIKLMLRRSFKECISVRDILMLIALCMQRDNVIREFLKLPHLLYTALYRARDHSSDRRIAGLVLTIVARVEKRGCFIEDWLLQLCIKFAARSRNLRIMQRALHEFRQRQKKMSCQLFRSVVAKFSIGRRGYGEVRNGRWKRSDLLQVLLGFKEPISGPPSHLASFLQRDDWQFLHGWIMLLARCRAIEELNDEWHWWLKSPMRGTEMMKARVDSDDRRRLLFQLRGDHWFIRHMLIAGDAPRAWKMVEDLDRKQKESDPSNPFSFLQLPSMIRNVLLEHLDVATLWNEEIRQDLLRKYAVDLATIEARLGVHWVSDGTEGGWHEPHENMPLMLEELSRADYFKVFGYITDTDVDETEVLSVADRLSEPAF